MAVTARRALLTELDWHRWFGVSVPEARRLVRVQRLLLAAGIDWCPDTVLGMSRTVLADRRAALRLRHLALLWELEGGEEVEAEAGWPLPGELACGCDAVGAASSPRCRER